MGLVRGGRRRGPVLGPGRGNIGRSLRAGLVLATGGRSFRRSDRRVAHPLAPAKGWPGRLSARLPPAAQYWAVFCALVAFAGAAAIRFRTWHRRWRVFAIATAVVAGPLARWARPRVAAKRRQGRLATASARRIMTARKGSSALTDRRDQRGFASSRQLRQETSVAAARRRSPYTRPSLAAAKSRLAPHEVGYPLGRGHPRGASLWPSWEASLRLVAPGRARRSGCWCPYCGSTRGRCWLPPPSRISTS